MHFETGSHLFILRVQSFDLWFRMKMRLALTDWLRAISLRYHPEHCSISQVKHGLDGLTNITIQSSIHLEYGGNRTKFSKTICEYSFITPIWWSALFVIFLSLFFSLRFILFFLFIFRACQFSISTFWWNKSSLWKSVYAIWIVKNLFAPPKQMQLAKETLSRSFVFISVIVI